MLPYQVNYYGNPHSRTHAYGWESETAMETARKVCGEKSFFKVKLMGFYFNTVRNEVTACCLFEQQVADLIGADPREIIFTSGATESNNMAIKVLPSAPSLLLIVQIFHYHLHSFNLL